MDPPEVWDPYSRPARRTQWLVSALAYHYGLDRGVENEIIVLATGLDQYLQEIFHHLDCEGEGKIPGDDFQTLCLVLGLQDDGDGEAAADPEECAGLCENLSPELTFRQFHAKLCGYFSTKAGCKLPDQGVPGVNRLPLGKESEHIETQIRLRSPLRRRREAAAAGRRAAGRGCPRSSGARSCSSSPPGSCSRECYEEIVALEQAEDRIVKLEDENASLRELVEDMRAALQSSDARCLALQVGLWKSHAQHKKNGTCFIGSRRQQVNNRFQTSKCLQSVLKEVELIRTSRDGQIEEAIKFNQELEKELRNSHEALIALEDCNHSLKREQAEMRKKVEEARCVIVNSLGKVKELETKAHKVSQLQLYIQQLESQLQYYRSEVLKCPVPSQSNSEQKKNVSLEGQDSLSLTQQDRHSPTGGAGVLENVEDQMFRSVEGQAASDEEEEKWIGDQQSQMAEVKKLLARFPCCNSGCDDTTLKQLRSSFGNPSNCGHENSLVELVQQLSKLKEDFQMEGQEEKVLETNMEETKGPLLGEIQQKVEESELMKMEFQMLETERVRLSLVEEKLLDVLQLLQQLRDLNISKRTLGKILLNTLESCCDSQHGKPPIVEVLDALYHELAACKLAGSKSLEKTPGHQSLSSSLVISC
ncbi:EF-hand and coiled-coil domain-containing protein 1 isoform X2 [Pantherophis guttatus]|uniref:EF-hand and coiled-coil domain-containing protein 1 isoform X2 n=1 Tax=Pantherophis guttatus TaxID=94885 RepID=A0ABM3Z7K9_PANGU|nr:EF-hand and coiled-coil domain-containing protein 1 isoform X2 [Pantherophis guttatus]